MKHLKGIDGSFCKVVPDGEGWKIVTSFLGVIVGPRLAQGTSWPDGDIEKIQSKEEAETLCSKWNEMMEKCGKKKK